MFIIVGNESGRAIFELCLLNPTVTLDENNTKNISVGAFHAPKTADKLSIKPSLVVYVAPKSPQAR
jgi:hypothetical protein